jgi:hypothetical protein
MMRIIVEVEGGLVRAVWSTDQTISVEIMDRDIPENDEDTDEYIQEIAKLEADVRNLNMVDIS